MKLGTVPKLPFLTRKARARDSFVGSSLTSSEELSDRLLTWSRSNDRERPHIMRFRKKWQHPNCPVMKWYIPQKSSSTRFQVIEHHQNVQGPFFHEFLLLRLTDGAICRIERTGNGSRADALRRVGCAANDLIQWFTSEDYTLFAEKVPSKLIATIDLGQEFDILEVLAICYSIQKTRMCRVYTLQRYNCYFFCLTILSVLTRRVAGRENAIVDETWDQSMNASFDALLEFTSEQAKEHFILRLCAVLDPSSSKPAEFIIEELRMHLASQRGGPKHVNNSLGSTLWHTGWKPALDAGLEKSADGVSSKIVYQHENACALALRSVFDDSADMMRQKFPCYDTLRTDCAKELFRSGSLEMIRFAKVLSHEQEMMAIENSPGFGARIFCSLAGLQAGLHAAVNPAMLLENEDDHIPTPNILRHADIGTRVAAMKATIAVMPPMMMNRIMNVEPYSDIVHRQGDVFKGELAISTLSAAMDKMEAMGTLGSLEAMGLVHSVDENIYWQAALASLVTATFGKRLKGILHTYDLPAIRVSYVETNTNEADLVNVSNFQDDHIIKRIQAHASRVATHQLAAADLVVRDMQHTMSEVWKKMPLGFGARLAEVQAVHTNTPPGGVGNSVPDNTSLIASTGL